MMKSIIIYLLFILSFLQLLFFTASAVVAANREWLVEKAVKELELR
ncbi:MAG: hypothetical protein HQK70_10710 [Desulfamplus sp.]|nr:hypothetical protein [Desulfamplus sp.]